jgi:hypothetical protein
LGGGKELSALAIIGLIWKDRPRGFYYIIIQSLDKAIEAYFKLAYANPRPYMISD